MNTWQGGEGGAERSSKLILSRPDWGGGGLLRPWIPVCGWLAAEPRVGRALWRRGEPANKLINRPSMASAAKDDEPPNETTTLCKGFQVVKRCFVAGPMSATKQRLNDCKCTRPALHADGEQAIMVMWIFQKLSFIGQRCESAPYSVLNNNFYNTDMSETLLQRRTNV